MSEGRADDAEVSGTDDEDHRPPGWDTNPSAWGERLPLVALAAVGVAISTYLALFQFGVLKTVWEPFFGGGSRTILTSSVSHVLPIPDAALGAFSYFLDVVTGIIGGEERWRTRPWVVIIFGLAVGPLGAISILLVILQPVMFDAWCTLCLLSALISLAMISPALDEMLASLQYLRAVHDEDGSVWAAFWKGTRRESVAGGGV
ncbi:vitamin K epoxide reductase family protein [Salinirubellus sp. GCM10025818]|uniref:vitamin K epoxide reductase family protein n=1 Tax=Salinirubellus TaxID=2162630 RepID=UPI0030D61C9E